MYQNASVSFFMGANTPLGFYSLFDGLYDAHEGWRAYVIKGGPGTGKSTLMKKIAAEADARGYFCERIHCSSDPASLDAVIIPHLKTAVADGTPPHALEPRYPGVCETIVDLGAYRDDKKLSADAEEIVTKTDLNSAEHKKCVGFLAAAKSVTDDAHRFVCASLRPDKLKKFAYKLAQNSFGAVSNEAGREKRRFLSALTPEGGVIFGETFNALCEKHTVLEDEYGVAASLLLTILKDSALESGHDCIVCPCPTDPQRIEHLLIPSLSMGYFTSNAFHPYQGEPDVAVDCARFSDADVLKRHRNRISFDRRAAREMLDEAVGKLHNAKAIHDELERYYIGAMDFDRLGEAGERLIREIFSI